MNRVPSQLTAYRHHACSGYCEKMHYLGLIGIIGRCLTFSIGKEDYALIKAFEGEARLYTEENFSRTTAGTVVPRRAIGNLPHSFNPMGGQMDQGAIFWSSF